jgi:hypothetical protein
MRCKVCGCYMLAPHTADKGGEYVCISQACEVGREPKEGESYHVASNRAFNSRFWRTVDEIVIDAWEASNADTLVVKELK